MIQGFTAIVQEDLALNINYLKSDAPTQDQKKKVNLAAIRQLAILVMGIGLHVGIKAFFTASIGGTTLGVLLYALGHDVFKMSHNESKLESLSERVKAVGQTFWNDLKDFWHGNLENRTAQRQPITEGTLLRPLWDVLIKKGNLTLSNWII